MKKILFVLILIGGTAGWIFYRQGFFRERTVENELKLYGNVEMRQVLLGFRVPGRIEAIHCEEGQAVTSGDLLGELDPLPYEIKLAEARAALRQAHAALAKMQSGYRTEEIRQAAAGRDQIRASLDLAEKDHARLTNLFSQRAISRKDLDAITSTRDRLRAELTAAESSLALMRGGYRTEDVEAAEAAVDLAEAQLREAENALSDTRLYAPSEGTVIARVSEPGTVVGTGQPVYTVMLKNPIQIRTYVTEPQLGRIRLGMKGKIITDSMSRAKGSVLEKNALEGTITFIASEAEFTPKQVQTEDMRVDLVYRIRLRVEDNPEDHLKNGMPVTVLLPLK